MPTFRILGHVIDNQKHQGLTALRVEAWDKDLICNDFVGSAITDEHGAFQIVFNESYFRELFLDRQPDLFFKVFYLDKLIKSTEHTVLWNIASQELPVLIEIEGIKKMEIQPELKQFQAINASGLSNVIQVSLPASAYFDLDTFQSVQKDILGKLGCPGCTSGFDIRYLLQRQFIVNEKMIVREVSEPLS